MEYSECSNQISWRSHQCLNHKSSKRGQRESLLLYGMQSGALPSNILTNEYPCDAPGTLIISILPAKLKAKNANSLQVFTKRTGIKEVLTLLYEKGVGMQVLQKGAWCQRQVSWTSQSLLGGPAQLDTPCPITPNAVVPKSPPSHPGLIMLSSQLLFSLPAVSLPAVITRPKQNSDQPGKRKANLTRTNSQTWYSPGKYKPFHSKPFSDKITLCPS